MPEPERLTDLIDESAGDGDRSVSLCVPEEDDGRRLDAWLACQIPDLSRNYAETLIKEGHIRVNGQPESVKKRKVRAGDEVQVLYPEPKALDAVPQNLPIDIVYEDEDVIVVNKARGMVVHPSAGNEDGTLVNAILYHCGDQLSTINGTIRPGIVHRIDKDTSGLLVIAKNDRAHESLAEQLRVHSMTREYQALCFDNIREDELTIDAPIGRDERNRLRRAVNGSNPKEAVTHIRVLERFGRYTLVSARLETGRTHQIRVHMSSIRHPLVGDTTYGPAKQPFGLSGQLLHAKTLGFIHPSTGEYMEFSSELPEYFREVLRKIRRA
ncbi:MAG: RluA family pseudouridine synthase [Mogibacterium sp.]|nr:RluA family pseudouridine synthase [Mogibacterium sp.]